MPKNNAHTRLLSERDPADHTLVQHKSKTSLVLLGRPLHPCFGQLL